MMTSTTYIKHTLINKKKIICSYFKSIIHISDIHIKPLERHNEYNEVFNNLNNFIKKHSDIAVVVTGDIFDNKTVFKPETFYMVKKFIRDISLFAPVFIIAGNHDMLENNTQRMDALTPVLNDMNNVFYLSLTGIYAVNDYNFVVLSLQDKVSALRNALNGLKIECSKENKKVICLYHGTLNEILYSDLQSKDHLYCSDFDFCDLVLLGDIHKRQKLKNNIAYAGSLIQQNFGESINEHGGLFWDIQNGECKEFNVKNNYAFIDVIFNSGSWINKNVINNCNFEHVYVRLIIDQNTQDYAVSEVVKELTAFFKSCSIVSKQHQRINKTQEENKNNSITNVNEVEMIKKECDNLKMDTNFILSLHSMYKQEALQKDNNDYYSCIWKPEKIEFQNLFGFGSNRIHVINFENGIYSIQAPNGNGKTSIMNALLFGIYGKTPLVPFGRGRTYDIINNNEKHGFVRVYFVFNNTKYILYRENKQSKQVKQDSFINSKLQSYTFNVELYECGNSYSENGRKVSETGNGTDEVLMKMFGDIEYFLHSNMLDKEASKDIASSTAQTERLRILKKIFHLDYYDEYKALNSKNIKNIKANRDSRLSEIKGMESLFADNDEASLCEKEKVLVKNITNLMQKKEELGTEKKALEEKLVSLINSIEINNIKIKNNKDPYSKEIFEEFIQKIKMSKYYQNEEIKNNDVSSSIIKSKIKNLEDLNDEYLKHIEDKTINEEIIEEIKSIIENFENQEVHNIIQCDIDTIKEKYYECKTEIKRLKKLCDSFTDKSMVENELSEEEIIEEINSVKMQRENIMKNNRNLRSKKELETQLYYLRLECNNYPKDIEKEDENKLMEDIKTLNVEVEILKREIDCKNHNISLETLLNLESKLKRKLSDANTNIVIPEKIILSEDELIEYQCINETIDSCSTRIDQYFEDFLQDEKDEATKIIDIIDTYPYKKISSSYVGERDETKIFKRIEKDTIMRFETLLNKIKNYNMYDNSSILKILFDDLYRNNQLLEKYNVIIKNNELHDKLVKEKEANALIINELEEVKNKIKFCNLQDMLTSIKKKETLVDTIKKLNNIKEIENQLKNYKNETETEDTLNDLDDYLNELEENLNFVNFNKSVKEHKMMETKLKEYYDTMELQKKLKEYKKYVGKYHKMTECYEYLCKFNKNNDSIIELNNLLHDQEDYEQYVYMQDQLSVVEIKLENDTLKEQHKKIKICYDPILEDYEENNVLLNSMEKELIITREKINTLQETSTRIKNIVSEIKDIESHLKMLEDYDKLISNKGLPSKILYDIIKSIEYYINSLITSFLNYKLEFLFDYEKQYLEILCLNVKTQKMLSFQRLSGYEKCVVRLALKRAINKFSCNAKSSIILIDEAFDCIDEENFIKKLPQLISLISDDYELAMIISQRDLSHVANKVIKIKNNSVVC